ncbi:MAG: 50S ribosomal protein L18 [Candidatus Woesearchaeota archaeon]
MARNINKNRVFKYNRRVRGQTNYHKRLELLKSKLPRCVIRKSNNGMLVQITVYQSVGDNIITSARARDLVTLGYTLHTGNIVAAYLTGMLAAKRALKAGVKEEVIVDFGLQRIQYGNRLFAVVKGLIDGGLNVRVGEGVFPSEERLNGEHLSSKDAQKVISAVKDKIGGMK